jgi:hypothetical protein
VFKKNQLIIITIIVSVSFHLVILYLMQQGGSSKALKDSYKTPNVKPLQAQLIFELPTQPIAPPIPEPQSEPEHKPEPIEQPAKIEKEVEPPTASISKETAIIKAQPPTIIKPQVELQKALDAAEPVIQKIATSAKINSQFTGTAGKHVQQYNAEQDAQMVSEASRYFQQQKNSPLIHAPKRNKFVTEEEKLMNQTKIRANCNGAARATAAMLFSFMGGRVDCTSPPPINSFINKRINKEHSLPAKYNRPLDKLPKSVVIKD